MSTTSLASAIILLGKDQNLKLKKTNMTMLTLVENVKSTKNTLTLLSTLLGWRKIQFSNIVSPNYLLAHGDLQLSNSWTKIQQEINYIFLILKTLGIYAEMALTMLNQEMDLNGFMKSSRENTEFCSTLEMLMVQFQL